VTHTRERDEKNQSEERIAVKTGRGETTAKSRAGLDGNNVPHSIFGRSGGLRSMSV
jgi:hypothetical protein